MRVTQRLAHDSLTKRTREYLPDGAGGTITGGPMQSIDLTEILERGTRGASRGGAVSGAAQVATGSRGRPDRTIALSDGSRISFHSIADPATFHDDIVGLEGTPVTGGKSSPRIAQHDGACVRGKARAHSPASV